MHLVIRVFKAGKHVWVQFYYFVIGRFFFLSFFLVSLLRFVSNI